MTAPLLEIKNLVIEFPTADGTLCAVDDLSLTLERGETLGIVGESGSGKSVSALAILGLLEPPGRIAAGEIWLNGRRIDTIDESEWLHLRGKRIAMIFQEPATSLNPLVSIGAQILEALNVADYDAWRAGPLRGLLRWLTRRFGAARAEGRAARHAAGELLSKVRIPDPQAALSRYPASMSGGMMQRVMISIAIASSPDLLIADEPTTALDVTIQAQVLDILRERRDADGLTMMLITHDLGLVAELCDRVVVMYAGQAMEMAGVEELFDDPLHPYTRGLLASIPSLERPDERLQAIEGAVPEVAKLPRNACHFAWNDRCPLQTEICRSLRPPMSAREGGRRLACHVYSHPSMRHLEHRLRAEIWPPRDVPEMVQLKECTVE